MSERNEIPPNDLKVAKSLRTCAAGKCSGCIYNDRNTEDYTCIEKLQKTAAKAIERLLKEKGVQTNGK